jgi:hypothetical protein
MPTRCPPASPALSLGQNGYRRALLADSPALGGGHLLYALEALHNDGPFVHPDDYRKLNGVLRYSQGDRFTAGTSRPWPMARAGMPPTRSRSAPSMPASWAAST